MKLLFIFLLLYPVLSNASNWINVGRSSSGAIFFIDSESINRSGDSLTFWGITNYPSRGSEGTLSSKTQRTINCRSRELIFRYFLFYDDLDGKGKLINSYPADSSEKWEPIAPDTMNDALLRAVCKFK